METVDEKLRKTSSHMVYMFISAAIMLIGFLITQIFFEYFQGIHDKVFISTWWVLSVFPALLYIAYLQKKGIASFRDTGLTRDNLRKGISYGITAGLIAGVMGWLFLHLIGSPTGHLPWNFIMLSILSSVFSAPIREEILIRGIMWSIIDDALNLLGHKFKSIHGGRKDAILITVVSLTFLFMHIGRPLNVLFTIILFDSFVYSLVYWKTRNLIAPMTAHAISNLFVILRVILFA